LTTFNWPDTTVFRLFGANGFQAGILLHLRGNVQGYVHAGSKLKYLRFITGRHDLPFYYSEEAALQKSFLDAFLKGKDAVGWATPGKVPLVSVVLRESGVNNLKLEHTFERREESAWPLPTTQYQRYYLFEMEQWIENPRHRRRKEAINGMLWGEYLLYFSPPKAVALETDKFWK
jgi:predicted acyl esterase